MILGITFDKMILLYVIRCYYMILGITFAISHRCIIILLNNLVIPGITPKFETGFQC